MLFRSISNQEKTIEIVAEEKAIEDLANRGHEQLENIEEAPQMSEREMLLNKYRTNREAFMKRLK